MLFAIGMSYSLYISIAHVRAGQEWSCVCDCNETAFEWKVDQALALYPLWLWGVGALSTSTHVLFLRVLVVQGMMFYKRGIYLGRL